MLVIEAENVSSKFAVGVKDQLEKSGCRILGVVLNKVEVKGKGYYGYYGKYGKYYHKYYGDYYGSASDEKKD